ncbi:MAG: translation initiation factor IF-2 [Verrucomicrobiae bacterium]|nr:translation initiation factor IF-2 [Verrucomicrobiae bacterium]
MAPKPSKTKSGKAKSNSATTGASKKETKTVTKKATASKTVSRKKTKGEVEGVLREKTLDDKPVSTKPITVEEPTKSSVVLEKKDTVSLESEKKESLIVKPVEISENKADEVEDKRVVMKPPIIVKDLAGRLNCKPYQLVHDLMEMNIFAALNQTLEVDVARRLCEKRGYTFEIEKRDHEAAVQKPKEKPAPTPIEEAKEILAPRAPVIAFMGHVDHGKTSLMDAIRQTQVARGEAGGITQHIGAYTAESNGHKITFLDTPGHAAFSAMRARGANVTDIVVLVVAADDGLMPQTLEAIAHAKAAGVKIMVALNKMDLPGADSNRVKGQLQEQGLQPEEWGGETIVCEVSATKKTGIDRLLENMSVLAEVLELKANPKGLAKGTVIEAQLEQGRGAIATVLVQSGSLEVGDPFICGDYWGKVKSLFDDKGKAVKSAGPSTPVKVLGFSGVPLAGEAFIEMESEREARTLSEERQSQKRLGRLEVKKRVTLENIFETLQENDRKALSIVLKGDVQGSVEAIHDALMQIKSEKVGIEIIYKGVGPITESDVMLASASNAVVIGFNTKTENVAAGAAKREEVQIKLYSIIYELIDQVKEAMAGLLDPVLRETTLGTAICKQVIRLSKFPVAGCMVQSGRVTKSGRARVLRNRQPIYDGGIVTLKRFQDEVNEVRSGLECGIRLGDFSDYEVGDVIECYQLEKTPQQL